ncbi:hypothetical protein [Leeuwenhoekiella sp. LLG6367-2.1]|uniref:hypothetical protein n=1 Tax=Leeuwenhoekiella sp. LLG6367-2.1 TaxID=3160833 RepID=UPI0038673ACC
MLSHFLYWIGKQDLTNENIGESVTWFISKFNEVSGRGYVATDEIKKLFAIQLKNGFSGSQMVQAVRNLYHHNNDWHRKNNYEFATPDFLLKAENLNKFLNAKY